MRGGGLGFLAPIVLALTLIFPATLRGEEQRVAPEPAIGFERLPPLPNEEGFGGMFAGTSGGALIAAGGANFPGKPPWKGGHKVYDDTIWVLKRSNGAWRRAIDKLAQPLGYGVSVTFNDQVICVGGADNDQPPNPIKL